MTNQAAVAVKAPSKKSQAQVIFNAKLAERASGLYGSNKEFRAAILGAIETDLGVSRASASTMYNFFKSEVEKAGTATLGRDPKRVKAPSTGKKGRPVGSGKKAKTETPEVVTAETPVVADTTA